ncbi:MAG: hypothetical protein CL559_14465 [Alphaproteobacteria bacterium]|nr:hypothetical protein [Alphaproteobacteria bacterium]
MFIYADETGHSGRNIFSEPPLYRIGALLSVADAEKALEPIVLPLARAEEDGRLHANNLGPARVAALLPNILDALDSSGPWRFLLGEIEKDYVATTKFVDTVFDSGENAAVPQQWYNLRLFRHSLCLAVDGAMRERHREAFWQAYLEDDITGISSVAEKVGVFARTRVRDPRLREVMRDGIAYLRRHPEDFTLSASRGRRSYQGHTPNIIAFSFIFDAVHQFVDETGSQPKAFIHDRQQEFGTSMREWAKLFGHIRREDHRGLAKIEVVDYRLPNLSLPSSKDNAALQAVDLLLWTLTRDDAVLGPCRHRLEAQIDPYSISRGTSKTIVNEGIAHAKRPMSKEALERGRGILAKWEDDRQQRIRERRSVVATPAQ